MRPGTFLPTLVSRGAEVKRKGTITGAEEVADTADTGTAEEAEEKCGMILGDHMLEMVVATAIERTVVGLAEGKD